jgi:homoserine O-acetyltransferase/O-succinyltransferase
MKYFEHNKPFALENGQQLSQLTIAYQTYGRLNATKSNVVWVCHALTANALAEEWWPGFIGKDWAINTNDYFIVCANILGSCYGTSGPLSHNPDTNTPYFQDFPFITIRDMVKAHQLLCQHLEIEKIHLLIGGSMGGYQALEWCCMQPALIENLFLIATAARESAWGIAIHTAQRLAIEADCSWKENNVHAGEKGLKTARAIGMVTYRSFATYATTQTDADMNKTDDFRASSYIHHQGQKLVNRFNAFSYYNLTKAMDSHNIARGRSESVEKALQQVQQKTLLIGISSDILCPSTEMQNMATHMPNATYIEIDSLYGHDGFLIETEKIAESVVKWLKGN